MKSYAKVPPLAPTLPGQLPGMWYTTTTSIFRAPPAPLSKAPIDDESFEQGLRKANPALIYVVDDEDGLTELYTLFLTPTGNFVRPFKCRASALSALAAESQRPDLLILDCLGHEMPVEPFMQRCLDVHPSLRILMVSGLSQPDVQFSRIRPHRFLQKPFTADEFLREVKAALTRNDFHQTT